MNSPIVGIDLGTTNSLVAVASWPRATDVPRVLPDSSGSLLIPSVVRFQDAGVLVGAQAKADAAEFPHTTIASVKRLMGRSLADARADIPYLSYAVVQGEGETARVALPAIGSHPARLVSPQEVSAHVLRALRSQASAALGVDITRAVITVPAYFDDAQRQATRDAARLAGLEAVRLVAEPTAAALAYGLGLRAAGTQKPQSIVVYDLGGGTFDISILRLTPGAGKNGADAFEVLSTAGDTHLGGDDIDFAIVRWLVEQAVTIRPDLPMPSDAQRRRLLAEAERAKIALSEAERVDVDLRWLIGAEHGSDLVGRASSPADLRTAPSAHQVSLQSGAGGDARPTSIVRLDRTTLDALAKPLIDRTIAACQRALRDAKRSLDGEGIDTVILVGGATRMPLVRARVREFFKLEPYTAIDPDQAVALGAAVQASVLDSANAQGAAGVGGVASVGGAMLLDVIPLSLGLETAGGGTAKIIMRNSPVPARASEMFSTQKDGQGSILLNVVQGEREMAADCRSLGTYHLRGIPAMPAGLPQLRVDFFVDANGILSVTAIEQRSQRRLAVQIVPNHGLTREEVDRIERESFAFAKEDMARHRVADLIANSTLDAGWIRTQLGRYSSALPIDQRDAIAAALAELDTLIAKATASWSSVEPDGFMRAKERLDRASMPLHEAAMTQSLREMTDRPPASA